MAVRRRSPQAPAAIVDEGGAPAVDGQMSREAFLEKLRAAIHRAGSEEYEGTRYTIDGCPVVAAWFATYGHRRAAEIERAVRLYTGGREDLSAEGLIERAAARARVGFREQARSGALTEIPEGLSVVSPAATPGPQRVGGVGRQLMRGCVRGEGGKTPTAGPVTTAVPVTIDVPMDGCVTVTDAYTTLRTGGFAGCWGIIVIGADGARTMAHIGPMYQATTPRGLPEGYVTPEGWPHIGEFRRRAQAAKAVYIYQHGSAFDDDMHGPELKRLLGLDPAKVQLMGKCEPIYAYPDGSVYGEPR